MPPVKVEVADAPVVWMAFAWRPLAKVEVPMPREYKRPLVVADWEKSPEPVTAKVAAGVEVPTPTRPLSVTVNRVVDAISDTRNAVDEVDPLAHTVRRAGAVEVPMARKFWVGSMAKKVAEVRVVAPE